MQLLFVADGRSPIARGWIRFFVERGDEVTLVSSFRCDADLPLRRVLVLPVAFASARKSGSKTSGSGRAIAARAAIRHWLGPLTLHFFVGKLRRVIREVTPDLVHAMRIPFEGMLAAAARQAPPLIVSIWGNDFTLHAPAGPIMAMWTRRTMRAAAGLHTDCQRDVRLADAWGFDPSKPATVIPGNGGVRLDVFFPPRVPPGPVVLNPRGSRTYVNNDAFFRAIPLVLKQHPSARFICASMAGDRQAGALIRDLGVSSAVELLEPMPHEQMAEVYRRAQVLVSPALHDGMPNSLLEGMACGCFPVAGDLESIREWITNGRNGLLVDPSSPGALAEAIVLALDREDLRREAAGLNQHLVAERADFVKCMPRAVEFYRTVTASG